MKALYAALTLLFVLLVANYSNAQSGSMNWFKFTKCAGHTMTSCAASKLNNAFDMMKKADCLNCDKYFHCKGNYNAVYSCSGSRATNSANAKKISDCREAAQTGSASDSAQDQMANAYGRNGGNCEAKYLCAAKCKWNPVKGTCLKSNC